jgi:hypothetical protein
MIRSGIVEGFLPGSLVFKETSFQSPMTLPMISNNAVRSSHKVVVPHPTMGALPHTGWTARRQGLQISPSAIFNDISLTSSIQFHLNDKSVHKVSDKDKA